MSGLSLIPALSDAVSALGATAVRMPCLAPAKKKERSGTGHCSRLLCSRGAEGARTRRMRFHKVWYRAGHARPIVHITWILKSRIAEILKTTRVLTDTVNVSLPGSALAWFAVAMTLSAAAAFVPHGADMAAYAAHDPAGDYKGLLSVTFTDLGTKGDSTLVVFPNESVMLIDGGMPSSYGNVLDALDMFGVDTVDVMVATHPDQDHVAGLNSLLSDSRYEVKQVLMNPTPKDTKTYQRFLEGTSQMDRKIAYAGHVIGLDDAVGVEVLSPPQSTLKKGPNAGLENTNSIVMLLEYGEIEFLFTADATHVTEGWLVDNVPADKLDVDIINAPHHGSKHSSTPGFIAATSPKLVIYSANAGNQYGHPHDEAVFRYVSSGVHGLQTGRDGDILIQTDGQSCSMFAGDGAEMPCFDSVGMVGAAAAPAAEPAVSEGSGTAAGLAEEPGDELLAHVANIRTLLEDAKSEYAAGDAALALDYVTRAYLENYGPLKNPLVDAGRQDLMGDVGTMLGQDLPHMIRGGESESEVAGQIDAILIRMDAVEAAVPEFDAAMLVMVVGAAAALSIATVLSRRNRSAESGIVVGDRSTSQHACVRT